MPIFKVIVKEEVTRKACAYVDAPDYDAADCWASGADDSLFRDVTEDTYSPDSEVESIEHVSDVPDGWKIRTVS